MILNPITIKEIKMEFKFSEKDFIDIVSSDDINVFYEDNKDTREFNYSAGDVLSKKYENQNGKLEVIKLLSGFCSMHMTYESKELFVPMFVFEGKRSFLPEDINEELSKFLFLQLSNIKNTAVRARISDSLWVAKKLKDDNINAAKSAVKDYCTLVNEAIEKDRLHIAHDYQNRIYSLCLSMRGTQEKSDLWTIFPEYTKSGYKDLDSSPYYWHNILDKSTNLQGLPNEKYKHLYDKVIEIISVLESPDKHHWGWIRKFYDVGIKLATILKFNNSDIESLKLKRIRVWEEEASSVNTDFQKAHLLKEALLEYQKLSNHKEDIERITFEISKLSRVMPYSEFSTNIDITEIVRNATDSVTGKPFNESVLELVLFIMSNFSIKKDNQLESARKMSHNSISFIIPRVYHDEYGKTIASYSSQDELLLLNAMEFSFMTHQMLNTAIHACIDIINYEHYFSIQDILDLTEGSPFFQQKNHIIMAKGIYALLKGEMMEAAHFLILQLENCLRHILPPDVITTIIKTDKSEENLTNISYLLTKCVENQILTEDWKWFFEMYLVEKIKNLRNDIAHGKFSDKNYYSQDISILCCAIMSLSLFYKAKDYKEKIKSTIS